MRHLHTELRIMGAKVGVANFFLGRSIGIDETKTYQLQFFSSMKIVGATGSGGLWALKWAWHIRVTNLRCVQSYGIQI